MNFIALADTTPNGTGITSLIPMLVMLVAVIGMMFFMSRKQKKEDQKVQQMKDSLQIGDEITTIGGIVGRIVYIKDETIVIETSKERTKIRFLKSAVKSVDLKAGENE